MTSAAIVVPAPGRFSTITCWPRVFDISAAVTREKVSVAPPGANATTRRTGFAGNACAHAPAEALATVISRTILQSCFMPFSSRSQVTGHRSLQVLVKEIHRQRERAVRLGLAVGPAAVAREGVVRARILVDRHQRAGRQPALEELVHLRLHPAVAQSHVQHEGSVQIRRLANMV